MIVGLIYTQKNKFCFPGLSTMSLDLFPMGETIFSDVSFDLSLNTPQKIPNKLEKSKYPVSG